MTPDIVRILTSRGAVAGAGFLCAPSGFILTCHHVVADALGLPRDKPIRQDTQVHVSLSSSTAIVVRLVASSPLTKHDLALLRVEERDMPAGAAIAPVALCPLTRGMAVRFYGFSSGYDHGVWAFGKLQFAVSWDRFQIDAQDIGPGFSGAPVQELQFGRIVGLVSLSDPERKTAFIITASSIEAFTKELTIAGSTEYYRTLTEGLAGLAGEPLLGVEGFLETYLGTTEAPVPFGGRDAQLAALDNWLWNSPSQCALLVAPAGRGKSALLAQWAAVVASSGSADVAFVPVSNRFETSSKSRTLALLAKRLRFVCGGELAKWPATPDEWLSEIDYRLRSDRPDPARPLLVILDGLDEASDWVAGADVRFRSRLGKGVKLLASARMLGGDVDETGWAERLSWTDRAVSIDLPLLDRAGLQQVLRATRETVGVLTSILDELLRLTEGDPLLVRMYVEALHGKGGATAFLGPRDLPDISPGLEGFITRWIEDQRTQWKARGDDPDQLEQRSQTLFQMLSMAAGPLTTDDVAAVAPPGSRLDQGLYLQQIVRIIARFIVGDGRRQGFVFSHPRLRDYYERLIGNARDRRDWHQRFVDYGLRILDDLEVGRLQAAEAPQYVIQYYRVHLTRLQAPESHFYRLISREWLDAWYARDGTYTGFLNDVSAVWELAELAGDRAVAIRCLLCHSSVVSRSSKFFPELLLRSVELQRLRPQQALAIVQQISEEPAVVHSIRLLAPKLSSSLLEQVVDVARSLRQPSLRLIALAVAASFLHGSRKQIIVSDVMHELRRLPPPELAAALKGLMPFMPEQVWPDLLDLTGGLCDEEARSSVLSCSGPGLTPMLAPRVLRMATSLRWAAHRSNALLGLATEFSRLRLPGALAAARLLPDRGERALYLVRLCSQTRSIGVAIAAMDAIVPLKDAVARAALLLKFIPHLPVELGPKAVEAALRLDTEDLQSRVLYALAPLLDAAHWEAVKALHRGMACRQNSARLELGHFLGSGEPLTPEPPAEACHPQESLAGIRGPLERVEMLVDMLWSGRISPQSFDEEFLPRLMVALDEPGAAAFIERAGGSMSVERRRELLERLLGLSPLPRELLVVLLPHLGSEEVGLVSDFLSPIHDQPEQARLMCLLARSNAPALAAGALRWLTAAEEPVVASGLTALAAHLADVQAEAFMDLGRNIQDRKLRAPVMVRLARRFGSGAAVEALAAIFAWREESLWQAGLIEELIPVLDQSGIWSALETIRTSPEFDGWESIVLQLRSRLPAMFSTDRALPDGADASELILGIFRDPNGDRSLEALASSIPTGYWRAGALARLAGSVYGLRQTQLFDAAVAELPQSPPPDADFIRMLIREMPPAAGSSAAQGLLRAAQQMSDEVCAQLLGMLAPKLQDAELIEAVAAAVRLGWDAILAIAPSCRHWMAQWRLLWGAQRLYQEYLNRSNPSGYYSHPEPEELLVRLAPRLRYSPVMRRALRLAHLIEDKDIGARAIVRLAAMAMPSESVLSSALAAVGTVTREDERTELLVQLAPYLWKQSADEGYLIAKTLRFSDGRVRALTAIHPQLTGRASGNCLVQIGTALPEASSSLQKEALLKLSVETRPQELSTLLSMVWMVWDSADRASLLRVYTHREAAEPAYAAAKKAEELSVLSRRARPLCSLLAHPDLRRDTLFVRRALAALKSTVDLADCVDSLFELCLAFPRDAEERLAPLLLKYIERVNPREGALKCLTLSGDERLPEALRQELLHRSWVFAGQLQPGEGLDRLDCLWPRLAQSDAGDAWRWSWTLPHLDLRRSIQRSLPRECFIPPDERAIKLSWMIGDPAVRFEAIWEAWLAAPAANARLAGELTMACVLEMDAARTEPYLHRCCRILDNEGRLAAFRLACEGLAGVTGVLGIVASMAEDGLTPSLRSELLRATAAIREEQRRAQILAGMLVYLLPECEDSVFDEVARIGDPSLQIDVAGSMLLGTSEALSMKVARAIVQAGGTGTVAWDTVLSASDRLRLWAAKFPLLFSALWCETTLAAARTIRASAIAQISFLAPAAVATRPEVAAEIEKCVMEVRNWWP